jgi:hypothetical protein
MILQQLLDLPAGILAIVGCGVLIIYFSLQYLLDPLKGVPGPFLARFTRLWYFLEIYKGSFEKTDIELHERYGPIVRIAPYEYSIDDIEAAKTIYGHGNAFVKVRRTSALIVAVPDPLTGLRHPGTGPGCHLTRIKPHYSRTWIQRDMQSSAENFPLCTQ